MAEAWMRVLSVLSLLTCALRATGAPVSVAPPVITGVATAMDGRPLGGTVLYLQDLPGGQFRPGIGMGGTVITDARGRFTLPPGEGVNLGSNGSLVPTVAACYALPLPLGWRVTSGLDPRFAYDLHDMMEKATVPCRTHWLGTGAHPRLAVVVPDAGFGIVTLRLRGPDGRPLAARQVQVAATGTFMDYQGALLYEGPTDAVGQVQLPWKSGLWHLSVSAPGFGFGSTGTFELPPGRRAEPPVPPLAPFARVSGTVAPALREDGAFVHEEAHWSDNHGWHDPHARVNAQGRFTLDDLLPGRHSLVLAGGRAASAAVTVEVYPGQRVLGVRLFPQAAESQSAPPAPNGVAYQTTLAFPDVGGRPASQIGSRAGDTPAATDSVSGHVTDAAGRPVAGADVYAVSTDLTPNGAFQGILAAKTEPDGAYSIPFPGPAQPASRVYGRVNTYVVAAVAGHPFAVWTAQPRTPDAPDDLRADLVLPPGHPGLTVRVLRAASPLAGASVRLTPQGGPDLFSDFSSGLTREPEYRRVVALLEPTAVTGPDGEAHFTDLAPGLWNVAAVAGGDPAAVATENFDEAAPVNTAFGLSRGVIVEAGKVGHFTVSIYPQPGAAAFRVLDPSGRPPAFPNVSFEYGAATSLRGGVSGIALDEWGNGRFAFPAPGLWRIETRFRDVDLDIVPVSTEPYYVASTVFAVSPSLPLAEPVVVHALRRDPGSIRVRLTDDRGRPQRGVVSIVSGSDGAAYGASIDAHGEAVFQGMPSGQYVVSAYWGGQPDPPALGQGGQPFPPDAAITRVRLLVPQTVTVKEGAEALAAFPELQGYVRGRVNAPPPDSPGNYTLLFNGNPPAPPLARYDTRTGEFVMGPFPPGRVTLQLQRAAPDVTGLATSVEDVPVGVTGGKAVHVTLTPAPPAPATGGRLRLMPTTETGLSADRAGVSGTVYLADGATPAWGARAALVLPQPWQVMPMARADALGRLSPEYRRYSPEQPVEPMAGDPAGPVVVAWLPGVSGATVVPYTPGVSARLVLPAPVGARGRVTVAGRSVTGLNAAFRVLAACQGRGKLNSLLSVETTAQADGSFALGGLTPGTYRIQAARDGIWLSQSQTLAVGNGPLPKLTLNIAAPGAPVDLRLLDGRGKALAGQDVEVMRPEGPLADALWPQTMTTDGRGGLHLEGLEAGQQAVRLSASAPAVTFPVPAFAAGDPSVQQTRVLR